MSSTYLANNTCSTFPGRNGDLQATVSRGQVIIDIQAASLDVEANVIHSHSVITLPYGVALALRDWIDAVSEPADQRQQVFPAIWSEASFTAPIARPRFPRRRRAAA